MLKIVCTEKHTDVVAAGDIATIVADFGESIGSLYMQITKKIRLPQRNSAVQLFIRWQTLIHRFGRSMRRHRIIR